MHGGLDTFSEARFSELSVSHRALSVNVDKCSVDVNWEAPVCHHVQQSVTTMQISSQTVDTTHSNSVVLEFALTVSFVGRRDMSSLEAG